MAPPRRGHRDDPKEEEPTPFEPFPPEELEEGDG